MPAPRPGHDPAKARVDNSSAVLRTVMYYTVYGTVHIKAVLRPALAQRDNAAVTYSVLC